MAVVAGGAVTGWYIVFVLLCWHIDCVIVSYVVVVVVVGVVMFGVVVGVNAVCVVHIISGDVDVNVADGVDVFYHK